MNSCRPFLDRLDDPTHDADFEAHLASCPSCREIAASHEALRAALRDLPLEPMPDEDFEAILDRTVRTAFRRGSLVPFPARRTVVWAGLAAAALAIALVVPGVVRKSSHPSAIEIARAREDAWRGLAIAGRALRRAETAGQSVLSDEVSPALRHVPLRWDRLAADSRRTRT